MGEIGMKKWTKMLCIFACILSLIALAACSNSSEPSSSDSKKSASKDGKTMFVGMTNPPATVNPINAVDVSSQIISGILFESLFDLDDQLNFVPKLAESMETEDNQNFVIKLNPNAKWTDGEPFTTKDIVFTLKLMTNPEVTSSGPQALSSIEGLDNKGMLPEGQTEISGLKIVDETTLNIKTKVPVDINLLMEKLGKDVRFLPEHILKDKDPATIHQDPFMQNPNVTNGAYTFLKYAKDQYVELSANREYYLGQPKIDKLFFKIMPSANLVAQLQTGEIHMNLPSVGPLAIEDLEKVKNMSNVTFIASEAMNAQQIFINLKNVSDKKVRQAIAYGIDREMMVEKLYKGEAEVTEGPYPSVHPYYNEETKKYDYDPEKAKQLLKEAGWDSSKTLDFAVPAGNKTREQMATVIAENLQAVGVKVQVSKYDIPTLIQMGIKKDYDLLMLGIPFQLDGDKAQFYATGGPNNFAGFSNPRFDELTANGKSEPEPAKRQIIYDESVEIIQEELPTITVLVIKSSAAVAKNVKAVLPKEMGMFYNIHEWDIE
jgi:peptide/nickel transport system substrate-binding protein